MSKLYFKLRLIIVLLGTIGLLNVFTPRSAETLPFVYVTKAPDEVAVIDAETNTVVDTIIVGQSPRDLVFDPEGNRAYVALSGFCGLDPVLLGCVAVIDTNPASLTFNTVLATIPVPEGPWGAAITPDGTRVYLTHPIKEVPPDEFVRDTVSVFDTTTNALIDTDPGTPGPDPPIQVGFGPAGVAITPDGNRAYVANLGPVLRDPENRGSVSVIDTDPGSPVFNTVIATLIATDGINRGINPRGVDIRPDGALVYVTYETNTPIVNAGPVNVIENTATPTFTATIPEVGVDQSRVAITPDGTHAYVTVRSNDTVAVINIDPGPGGTVITGIQVGDTPQGIAITAEGTRAYVANSAFDPTLTGTVSVIDTDPGSPVFNTVIATVDVGGNPFGVAISPPLTVLIDIKPGSFPNSINLGSGGNVPVAILSEPYFDALNVDPESVRLASAEVKVKGNGTPMSSSEDVNGDGLLDLVVHVETEALELTETDESAFLTGKTFDGTPIRGVDTIRIVP